MAEPKVNFFKTTMPSTRAADFHLGCLEGAVFIDIVKTDQNLICLQRISFDGYGCCELEGNRFLNRELSETFLNEVVKDDMDQTTISFVINKLIELNKDFVWKDALQEYNLIAAFALCGQNRKFDVRVSTSICICRQILLRNPAQRKLAKR